MAPTDGWFLLRTRGLWRTRFARCLQVRMTVGGWGRRLRHRSRRDSIRTLRRESWKTFMNRSWEGLALASGERRKGIGGQLRPWEHWRMRLQTASEKEPKNEDDFGES